MTISKKVEEKQFIVKISDHAIVRYLERNNKIDLEAVKQEIQDIIGSKYAPKGHVVYNRFAIKDGVVTTYLKKSAFLNRSVSGIKRNLK